MPKMKTHKGSSKRFRVTRNGKVLAGKANRRHNLGNKSANTKRGYRNKLELSKGDSQRIKKALPNG